MHKLFLFLTRLISAGSAQAFGDFPLASCKSNGGTETLDSCVEGGYQQVKDTQLMAIANCETGVLFMRG